MAEFKSILAGLFIIQWNSTGRTGKAAAILSAGFKGRLGGRQDIYDPIHDQWLSLFIFKRNLDNNLGYGSFFASPLMTRLVLKKPPGLAHSRYQSQIWRGVAWLGEHDREIISRPTDWRGSLYSQVSRGREQKWHWPPSHINFSFSLRTWSFSVANPSFEAWNVGSLKTWWGFNVRLRHPYCWMIHAISVSLVLPSISFCVDLKFWKEFWSGKRVTIGCWAADPMTAGDVNYEVVGGRA
jgi:hypothetical protein